MARSVFTKHKLLRYFIFLIVIAVISVGVAIGCYLYYGHKFDSTDLSEHENFEDKLILGASFTLDEIIDAEEYTYSWIKSNSIEVDIYALNSEEEYVLTDKVLSYSNDNDISTFNIVGVSKGKIVVADAMDSSVSVTFPFQTKFSKPDTENIIRNNYSDFYDDGIVDSTEIESIKELNLTSMQSYDISDFSLCPNLSRIIVSAPDDAVSLQGIDQISNDIVFYVTDGQYEKYLTSSSWSNYTNRVFPIVNLEEDSCTLVFEFNDGTMEGIGNDVHRYFSYILKGESIDLTDYELTRTGYTFLGWYTSNDNGKTLATKVYDGYEFTEDTKLYASWRPNEYDIVYHDDYATPPVKQHEIYDKNTNISSKILNRTGYTFLGWSTVSSTTSIDFSIGQTVSNLMSTDGAIINLYAVWAANSYSIVYNANGGSNPPANQEDVKFDLEVSISADVPTRTGYTFLGWSTKSNSTVADYTGGQLVKNLVSDAEGKVTLYAVWAPNRYSIKYDANGGTGAPLEQTDLAYGTAITLRTGEPSWLGRVFSGWSQNKNATTAAYAAGDTVSNLVADAGGSVTLYAVWTYATFKLQYDANGGSNAPSTSSYLTYDNSFKSITNSIPTRTGHDFKGWSTTPSGSVEYTSGQALTANEVNGLYNGSSIRTLYAVWALGKFDITVSTVDASITIYVGDELKYSDVTMGTYSFEYNSLIRLHITYVHNSNKYFRFNNGTEQKDKKNYIFNMPDSSVKIEAHSYDNCIASGSLITLADGSVDIVDNLQVGDEVLVFNHESGTFDVSYIAYIENDGFDYYDTMTLYFEEGVSVKVMTEHGFFDNNLNQYVMINLENASDYIGHSFFYAYYDGEEYVSKTLKLLDYVIEEEYLNTYSFVTAIHYNHFVNGLLGMAAGIDGLYNIFELDANMKYDTNSKQNDIETYGLATYDDWSDYLTYEEFVAFNGCYVDVAMGKGMITREEIISIITRFLHPELKVG